MVELLRHKVRFGELSYGPLLHYAEFFELLIEATEELCYELDHTPEEVVASSGVPLAPVAIHAEIARYPRYEDTIVVTGEPAGVGETNVRIDYRFHRAADGIEFGRASMVQVTITPEHTAEPISPALRERLESLGSEGGEAESGAPNGGVGEDGGPGGSDTGSPETGDGDTVRIEPRLLEGSGSELARKVTFRTPHLEAAGLGFFEDYARELSICLEEFLEDRGRSLRSLAGETYPFVPLAWDLVIDRSIEFEDEMAIVGRVLDADREAVEIAYEFRHAATGDVCIRAALTYGCFDDDGRRVAFEPVAIEAVSDE